MITAFQLYRRLEACELRNVTVFVTTRVEPSRNSLCVAGRFYVVGTDGVVLGRLYSSQLQGGDGWPAEELMQEGPSTTRASASIHEAQHMMADNELSTVPVTSPEGKLLGMVLRKDLE